MQPKYCGKKRFKITFSPVRGCRVVWDTEWPKESLPSCRRWISVFLPTPDGPTSTNALGMPCGCTAPSPLLLSAADGVGAGAGSFDAGMLSAAPILYFTF